VEARVVRARTAVVNVAAREVAAWEERVA
jgi:hypothetical protein